jgi:virulence factor Mce-like protein
VRRRQQPAFANPVLIGAVTVLVAVVAVFLAYNATNGLPFVPTRQLKIDFTNGAAVVDGNDVQMGGYRIGVVANLQPVILPNGAVGAQAIVNLSTNQGKVPVNSTATIRPRSALGLKYVDITRGSSSKVFSDGAVMQASQTSVPVQFDDIDTMFDAKTRPAIEQNLAGYGDALTARGSSLNDTIATLPPLLAHLQPVAQYLSDPNTELTRFFQALNGFMGTLSPVAQTNVKLFADQATTFEAISRSPSDLENTIKESPSTLDVSTASLKVQQPFLADLTTLAHALNPATASLEQALPIINPALAAGIKVLPRTPPVNQKLGNVLASLNSAVRDPGTNISLNGLSDTVSTLNPMIRYLGPYETVCNQWNYFWEEIQDLVSEQTTFGMAQRALIQFNNHQASNAGVQGATYPANGYQPGDPPDQGYPGDAEFAHAQAYAGAVDSNGNADCEVGQRGYPDKLNALDPKDRNLVVDAHTPGDQGTTWGGLAHVPAGETFSRNPQNGPQLPNIPGNQ